MNERYIYFYVQFLHTTTNKGVRDNIPRPDFIAFSFDTKSRVKSSQFHAV